VLSSGQTTGTTHWNNRPWLLRHPTGEALQRGNGKWGVLGKTNVQCHSRAAWWEEWQRQYQACQRNSRHHACAAGLAVFVARRQHSRGWWEWLKKRTAAVQTGQAEGVQSRRVAREEREAGCAERAAVEDVAPKQVRAQRQALQSEGWCDRSSVGEPKQPYKSRGTTKTCVIEENRSQGRPVPVMPLHLPSRRSTSGSDDSTSAASATSVRSGDAEAVEKEGEARWPK